MRGIDILLPTYNGGAYLEVLIDSILKQDNNNWKLIIRDDSSTDNTREIIKKYTDAFPDKIIFLNNYGTRYGILKNYELLLEASNTDYIMLCDQDDVWLPKKISKTLEKMNEFEKLYGIETPILIHSDLIVVDENLRLIENSFWRYQNLNPRIGKSLNRLLVQNIVTGCTVMINKSLKNLSIPFPDNVIVHDWWMAITAAAFGKIGYIEEPLINYRQHTGNAIGTTKFNLSYIIETLLNHQKRIIDNLAKAQAQAFAFSEHFKPILNKKQYKKSLLYATINKRNFISRRLIIILNGFFKNGFSRTIGMLFFI